jgi:hypothetical protein
MIDPLTGNLSAYNRPVQTRPLHPLQGHSREDAKIHGLSASEQ